MMIKKDRINITDWINFDPNNLYNISLVLSDIKRGLGKSIKVDHSCDENREQGDIDVMKGE